MRYSDPIRPLEDVHDDLNEAGMTPGTTFRIHGMRWGQYFVRLNEENEKSPGIGDGAALTVTRSDVRIVPKQHVAYILDHRKYTYEEVPTGEAFAFLLGDFDHRSSPDTTKACVECHTRYPGNREPPCWCDGRTVIDDIDYPDITPRRPRKVKDGKAIEVSR